MCKRIRMRTKKNGMSEHEKLQIIDATNLIIQLFETHKSIERS